MVAIWSGLEHGEQDRPWSVCRTYRFIGSDGAPTRTNRRREPAETAMASKNKGGREAKKPKQDQNKNKRANPARQVGARRHPRTRRQQVAVARSDTEQRGIQARNGPGWCPTAGAVGRDRS